MAVEYKFRGTTYKNQRRDQRVAVELPAVVDGEDVIVKDIGFGGMGFVADEDADLEVGDETPIEIDLGGGRRLALFGTIVREIGSEEYGVAFSGLTPQAFKTIEQLQTRQIRPATPRRSQIASDSSADV